MMQARVALPSGPVGVTPGSAVICGRRLCCHQVSTIGQRDCPNPVWYHIHVRIIGSPPGRARAADKSYFVAAHRRPYQRESR